MGIVYVSGVPGVGKTSVITTARKYIKKEHEIVNFGDFVLAVAKERKGIVDRDAIRKVLNRIEYIDIQTEAARQIAQLYEGKNIILDTHMLIETPFGFYSGSPVWVTELLKPDAVIIIYAEPEEILKRRERDVTREREIENIKRIESYQNLEITHALFLTFQYNAYLKIIHNKEGELEQAAKEFAKVIEEVL